MPTSWRIAKKARSQTAFDGEGARRYPGRWNNRGVPMIYTAESRSLATLEVLVNYEGVERMQLPDCVIFEVSFPDSVVDAVSHGSLPAGWDGPLPLPATRVVGDRWALARRAVVLKVPSAVTEGESNYLLNPQHPEFERIAISAPRPFPWDRRLAGP